MSYLLLDDGFSEHPKVRSLSNIAFRFHVEALNHCARNLTDGHVDERAVRALAAGIGARSNRYTAELVERGLWLAEGTGFSIHDYLEHNPSSDQIKARKEAGRKAARTRWGNADGNADRIAHGSAEPNGMSPSHPIPKNVSDNSQPVLATPGEDAHASGDGTGDASTFDRIVAICERRAPDARDKLERTRRANHVPESRLVGVLWAIQQRGTRDHLGKALAMMKPDA